MDFSKIVYLDEQAVYDFLQIKNGGIQEKMNKAIKENTLGAGAEGGINSGWLSGVFNLKLGGSAKHSRSTLVETQLSSTLISQFVEYVSDSKKDGSILELNKPKLQIVEDSPAYYRNISPVLDVISDVKKLSTMSEADKANFNGIDISKIKGLLDDVSGYYEMLYVLTNGETGIVRFNINGLRNNYSLDDLTRMGLKLYGIEVGKVSNLDLNFINRLENRVDIPDEKNEHEYVSKIRREKLSKDIEKHEYKIIDIVFAGV